MTEKRTDNWFAPPSESAQTPASYDRSMPEHYSVRVSSVRQWHAGPDKQRIDHRREGKLSAIIQEGRQEAEAALAAQGQSVKVRERLITCTKYLKDIHHPAIQALHELVESHLELAPYAAVLSMGIIPTRKPHTPIQKALTHLRRPRASLQDRTQIASEALIKAAWSYDHTARDDSTFAGFALTKIYWSLSNYIQQ